MPLVLLFQLLGGFNQGEICCNSATVQEPSYYIIRLTINHQPSDYQLQEENK